MEEVIERILSSKSYKGLDKRLVESLVAKYTQAGLKSKDIEKQVKKDLHIVYGIFQDGTNYVKLLEKIQTAADRDMTVKEILQAHTSTKERLIIADEFFAFLSPYLRGRIADLGCGLNPLFLSLYAFPEITEYVCYDVGGEIDFLNQAGEFLNLPLTAEQLDLTSAVPSGTFDTVLLFKLIPTLETIKKGSGLKLLQDIQARTMIVSFPTKSVGGRNKGMSDFYEGMFTEMTKGTGWKIERKEFENELVYIITK